MEEAGGGLHVDDETQAHGVRDVHACICFCLIIFWIIYPIVFFFFFQNGFASQLSPRSFPPMLFLNQIYDICFLSPHSYLFMTLPLSLSLA